MELTGYNVVVTGGSGGIGSALIAGLSQAGATVHNLDLQSPAPADAKFYKADLTDENSVKASLSSIKTIDALIVCAGVQLVGADSKITDVSLDTWQKTVDINMTGAFLSVKHANAWLNSIWARFSYFDRLSNRYDDGRRWLHRIWRI